MLQPTLSPTTLETSLLKLAPMTLQHLAGFCSAGNHPQVWQHMPINRCQNSEVATPWMKEAIDEMSQGLQIAFVTIDKKSNTIIGSTRFCNADLVNKRLEIGYTWYSKSYQRSSVNTECKSLLLRHAFETLNVIAVEFRTHWYNQESRKAIARLGAKEDGVLRNHQKIISARR